MNEDNPMSGSEIGFAWKCPHCGETIESQFDSCWNCGTTKAGHTPIDFPHVEDVVEAKPDEIVQARIFGATIEFQRTIPILRIFDVEKAKDFYVGFLGFSIEWEHHFEANMPAYIQITRAELTLHLSEHHGDACPGSTVFVWMRGIEEYHRELMSKGYKYLRPGLEKTFYNSKSVEVIDPFGNRIRFNEDLKPSALQ